MLNDSYEHKLHFFFKDGTRVQLSNDVHDLALILNALKQESIIAYYGCIILGEVQVTETGVTIGKHSFSKFADYKAKSKGFTIPYDCLGKFVTNEIELEELLSIAKPNVECIVCSGGKNIQFNPKYYMTILKDYVPFYHPEFSLSEMMLKREVENRVLYWKTIE